MQTRKFDELISYFNRNVSNMDIDQKSDNLKKWCEIIQTEMKLAMIQLPCWRKDGEEDA